MKINFNKQYMTVVKYVLLVVLCGILSIFIFTHFAEVWAKVIDFFNIFMPIFYGMAIAYLIYPIVKFFERKVFRRLNQKRRYTLARILSIIIVFLLVLGFIVLFCFLILPHIIEGYVDLQQKSNIYVLGLQEWLFDIAASAGEFSGYVMKLFEYLIGLMENLYEYIIDLFPDISSMAPALLGFVKNFFLGMVLSIYFLLAKEKLHAQIKKFLRAFLDTKKYRIVSQSARLADKNFGGYIKGQLADSFVMGVASYFFLMSISAPYFPLISTIVGITSLIPVIGTWLGAIIGAMIIFLANPSTVIWFAIFMIFLCIVNLWMIRPNLVGGSVDTSTMFMFAAIVTMTGLIGFWGLVIGVPIFVILYTLLHFEVDKRLQQKGLPVDQADYYETVAGQELYNERARKRRRRARKKEEPFNDDTEEFIIMKNESPSFETADMSVGHDTEEFVVVENTEDSSEEDNTTEEVISQ